MVKPTKAFQAEKENGQRMSSSVDRNNPTTTMEKSSARYKFPMRPQNHEKIKVFGLPKKPGCLP